MVQMIDLRKVPQVCYRKLGRFRADGLAWWAEDGRLPKIEVDIRLRGRAKFETLLHEALHLALPDLTEEQVLKAARFQALVTWAEGYRADVTPEQEP